MNIGAAVLVEDFLQVWVHLRRREKSGMAERRAFAVTSSDGGSAGFMVRSQLRNDAPDFSGVVDRQVLQQPLGDASQLDVDVKGGHLAADGGAVGVAGTVQILVRRRPGA